MSNKEINEIEKELMRSAEKLDGSEVGREDLEAAAAAGCCGGMCHVSTDSCSLECLFGIQHECCQSCISSSPN